MIVKFLILSLDTDLHDRNCRASRVLVYTKRSVCKRQFYGGTSIFFDDNLQFYLFLLLFETSDFVLQHLTILPASLPLASFAGALIFRAPVNEATLPHSVYISFFVSQTSKHAG